MRIQLSLALMAVPHCSSPNFPAVFYLLENEGFLSIPSQMSSVLNTKGILNVIFMTIFLFVASKDSKLSFCASYFVHMQMNMGDEKCIKNLVSVLAL